MFRHSPALALAAAIFYVASPQVSAQQQPDETQFFKKPTNAAEFWRAIQFEINVGKYEFAAELIRQLIELNPPDKELLELEAKEGLVPFLRLRNVERWARDPKADAEARKNVEALIERISTALKKELSDPQRIARFVRALAATPEEAAFAQREIRRSGAAAIPVIASILKENPPTELRVAITELLPRLDLATVPPLVAFLDVNDPTLKSDLLDSLRRRPDYISLAARVETDITPALWRLSSTRIKAPEALRRQARSMLTGVLQVDPEKRVPEAEITALAERIYDHKAVFAGRPDVDLWRWDGNDLTSTTVSVSAAEEYFGLRYARWALELRPDYLPAQVLFASLALDKTVQRHGPDKPLSRSNPALYQMLAAAPYELLAETLDRALREKRPTVALGVVQVLGDRADREAARPHVRDDGTPAKNVRPPLLVRALNSDDRRVQIAAAEALLRIPGPPTHGAGPRIVEVLRDSLLNEDVQADAPSKPKALLADPEKFRAEAMAALLRRIGFDVEIVPTGKDVLRRVRQRPDVDVLVVDRHTPLPMLPDFLAQSRADVRAGTIPLFVVASSERSASPQLLTVLARLAVMLAAAGRDDPEALAADVSSEVYRRQVDAILRDRQRQLQGAAENAGFPPTQDLITRVEYLTLLAHAGIFTKADIQRRIDELRPLVRPDVTEPASHRDRIEALLRVSTRIESELPAERLLALEKTWDRVLQQLPPWPGVRDEQLENRLRILTRPYRKTKVIPDVFTEASLRDELAEVLADPKTSPRTDAEKKAHAATAMAWLRRMATGEAPGFDISPAERALREALQSDALASQAIDAVAKIPTKEAQRDLANVVLGGNRPPELRLKAADALVKHLQLHGNVLGDAQVQLLLEQADREANAELRAHFQVIQGIVRPSGQATGLDFQRYRLELPAAPKEAIKEEPKEKEPKEKEPKDQ